jgi:hypothetical protein
MQVHRLPMIPLVLKGKPVDVALQPSMRSNPGDWCKAGVLANYRAATASLTCIEIAWVITGAFWRTDLLPRSDSDQLPFRRSGQQ